MFSPGRVFRFGCTRLSRLSVSNHGENPKGRNGESSRCVRRGDAVIRHFENSRPRPFRDSGETGEEKVRGEYRDVFDPAVGCAPGDDDFRRCSAGKAPGSLRHGRGRNEVRAVPRNRTDRLENVVLFRTDPTDNPFQVPYWFWR